MSIEEFRDYCLAKPCATEDTPFDQDTLVFKVCGKIFALCSVADFASGVNLKCDTELAIELRERYAQVAPGYHMNMRHWNTVLPDATLSAELMKKWIDPSYALIVSKLTKAQRNEISF